MPTDKEIADIIEGKQATDLRSAMESAPDSNVSAYGPEEKIGIVRFAIVSVVGSVVVGIAIVVAAAYGGYVLFLLALAVIAAVFIRSWYTLGRGSAHSLSSYLFMLLGPALFGAVFGAFVNFGWFAAIGGFMVTYFILQAKGFV